MHSKIDIHIKNKNILINLDTKNPRIGVG